MTDLDNHISDLRWDRMFAGELPATDCDEAKTHAASCARCGARLRELEAEREAFVFRPVAVKFDAAAPPARGRWRRGAPFATFAALAAAAMVVLVVIRKPEVSERERTKGTDAPALMLFAGPSNALAQVGASDTIRSRQYLQAGYTSKRDGFGAVLSIDGAGQASIYVPAEGETMVALPAGIEKSFPTSTLLDDVVGAEQIAIVWCEAAHPVGPMLEELRGTKAITARAGCTQRIVALSKVAQ